MAANETYEEFVKKFEKKREKATDDCITPPRIYETVLSWATARYGLQGRRIARPFYPGGDYEHYDYSDCVVVDNPPFSIASRIVGFYIEREVPFFLFANGLTVFNLLKDRPGVTAVITGRALKYDNGACVSTAYVTNLSPDVRIELARSLSDALVTKPKPKANDKVEFPDGWTNAARMGKIAKRIDARIPEAEFVRQLPDGRHIFGGGMRMNPGTLKNLERWSGIED